MSVVAREWLDRSPSARAVILDRAGLDAMAEHFFAPVRDQLTVITADIRDPSASADALNRHGITTIVHGATVTPISRGSAAESQRQPEAEDPARIIDINLMGTVRMLDWARSRPEVKRFIYVSSGAVYRHHGPDWSGEPLPEDGYFAPLKLYGISKFASELVVNRYADLFGLSAVSVRPSSVCGPMRSRNRQPQLPPHPEIASRIWRWPARSFGQTASSPSGDYILSTDVARAIIALIEAPRWRYRHYNIASAVTVTIGDIIAWARERVPGLKVEVSPDETANIVQDPTLKTGMWGAYDLARNERDTDWRPQPCKQAFFEYMDWIAANESV